MKLPELLMFAALVVATGDCLAGEPAHAAHTVQAEAKDTFAKYDADRDGVLTAAEVARHPMGAHASMADANRDGKLDKAEFAALEAMGAP